MSKEAIKHLLIPKQFRVYCLPNRPPGAQMSLTTKPGEAGCVNCLTQFRAKTTGKYKAFKKAHTLREYTPDYDERRTPVLPENL